MSECSIEGTGRVPKGKRENKKDVFATGVY
jgi:hypothetical protein